MSWRSTGCRWRSRAGAGLPGLREAEVNESMAARARHRGPEGRVLVRGDAQRRERGLEGASGHPVGGESRARRPNERADPSAESGRNGVPGRTSSAPA